MDRSRLNGLPGTVRFVRALGGVDEADIVIIDLARHHAVVRTARAKFPNATIVGFGPHEGLDAFATARTAGATRAMARSVFFRDPIAALREV
jgi:hypothetical protein